VKRTAVQRLLLDLDTHAASGSCWIVRRPGLCSLLVPDAGGFVTHLRQVRRSTLDAAEHAGLVSLGDFVELPPLHLPEPLVMCGHTHGRPIALVHGLAA